MLFSALLVAGFVLSWLTSALARKSKALSMIASTDALTGVTNRRRCLEQAAELGDRARQHQVPLTVVVIDLDHFKAVNDVHGHPVGDAVLQTAARAIERHRRIGDIVARLGGEEFALVLYGVGRASAEALCERVREALETSRTEVDGKTITVTGSIGAATGYGVDADFQKLYSLADKALYTAKETGRNKVVAIDHPGEGRRVPTSRIDLARGTDLRQGASFFRDAKRIGRSRAAPVSRYIEDVRLTVKRSFNVTLGLARGKRGSSVRRSEPIPPA